MPMQRCFVSSASGRTCSPARSEISIISEDSLRRLSILAIGALLFVAATCKADSIYDFTLETSGLVGSAHAPFALDFQLTSGDTSSGVANTATLSLFTFGTGGSPDIGNPFPNSGDASGDLGSTVMLNTSGGSFFNEFSQYFTPGSLLSFQLDLTNNPQSSGTPDEFTVQLIDNTLNGISTTDPSGSSSLVIVDLTGGTLQPEIFSTNGDGVIATPQLLSTTSAVPEPSNAWLIGPVLLIALWSYKRRTPQQARSKAGPRVGR
jgi:hypothetical protein